MCFFFGDWVIGITLLALASCPKDGLTFTIQLYI